MSNTLLRLKRSAVKGKAPTIGQLSLGELALNTNDGRVYFKAVDSASTESIVTLREILETNLEINPAGLANATGTVLSDVLDNLDSAITTALTQTVLSDATLSGDGLNSALGLSQTGVIHGVYGSSTQIPVLSITETGQIDSAGFVTVAGVSSLDFDSATGSITINTADGGSFSQVITLDPYTTDDLTEGSNLYYTTARFDSDLSTKTTGDLTEGSNLYYTTVRFDSDFSTMSTTDLSEGNNLYYTTARFDSDLGDTNTDSLTEGSTNLYYTTARADSDFDARLTTKTTDNLDEGLLNLYWTNTRFDNRLATKTTDDLTEGDNLYYTTARFDSDFGTMSTTNLVEGTNLYYTTARFDSDLGQSTTTDLAEGTNRYFTEWRARGAIDVVDGGGEGSLTYDSDTGIFTYTGMTSLTAGNGITISSYQVGLDATADVQFKKVTVDSADVGCIHLRSQSTPPETTAGGLFYDLDPQKGLSFIPTNAQLATDVTLNIGQEFVAYVYNGTGANIPNGTAVYLNGAQGNVPTIALAKADAASTAEPYGISTQLIPDGGYGYVTKYGVVRDVNTAGMTVGDTLYLSKDSAGKWSTAEVSVDSGFPTHMGKVLVQDGSEGVIYVEVQKEHYEYVRVQDKLIVGGDLEAPDIYGSHIHFDGKAPGYYKEGLIYYDSAFGALAVKNDEADITLQVGQEEYIRVYNSTDSDILNGTPVYLVGENNGVPTIAPADAAIEGLHKAVGFATHDIETLSTGYVTVRGLIADIDTSMLIAGGRVHVAPGGGIQTAAPTYPYFATDVGICLISDSSAGCIYVNVIEHTFETIRVTDDARFDADVTVGGNLTVLGTQSRLSVSNIATDNTFIYSNSGNTIGAANTIFDSASVGLNDLVLTGHYEGTTSNKAFYVEIDATDSAGDTFKWWTGTDSASPAATGVVIDTNGNELEDDIYATFNAETGHTVGDRWYGFASPVNVDVGFASNRNTGETGIGYTHVGLFFDVTDEKWKLFDQYAPEPEGIINTADSSYNTATLVTNIEGNVTGQLTGNAQTATALQVSRDITLSGDLGGTASFDGSSNINIAANIAPGVIVDSDIHSDAQIQDVKLATITTTGKVQNSATTATSTNTLSAIVSRDASGNFSAGTITADLTGDASNALLLNGDSAGYYLDYANFTGAPSVGNAFGVINVDGTDVIADSSSDTLMLLAGTGVTLTPSALNDSIIIASEATVSPLTTDLFSADSGQTEFTLSKSPQNEQDLMVFIEGVYQNYNSYSASGNTLTLSEGVDSGDEVVCHIVGRGIVGAGYSINNFTGDGATDEFTISEDPLTENNLQVYFDGVYQNKTEFSVSGTTLTFGEAPDSDTAIEVVIPNAVQLNVPNDESVTPAKLSSGGPSWNAQGDLTFSDAVHGTRSTTVNNTTETTICALDASTFRSVRYTVQVTDNTNSEYESSEVKLIHNGTTPSITEYGVLFTGDSDLGDIDANITSGDINLTFTAAETSNKTVKVLFEAIKV